MWSGLPSLTTIDLVIVGAIAQGHQRGDDHGRDGARHRCRQGKNAEMLLSFSWGEEVVAVGVFKAVRF